MLILTIPPTRYGVSFSHLTDGKSRFTVCDIYKDDAGKWLPLATDSTRCSKKDNFCKSVGRKVALQRTMLANKDLFPKNIRTRIWQEYWTACR